MHDRKPTPIWMRNESGYSTHIVAAMCMYTNNSFKIHPRLAVHVFLYDELIKMWQQHHSNSKRNSKTLDWNAIYVWCYDDDDDDVVLYAFCSILSICWKFFWSTGLSFGLANGIWVHCSSCIRLSLLREMVLLALHLHIMYPFYRTQ